MWFGTDRGVLRYDGLRWTPFTSEDGLPDAPVDALCATADGSVYAGTDRGICRFSGGSWLRVLPHRVDLPWHVNALAESADGSVWAATAWGALRLAGGKITLYTASTRPATAPSGRYRAAPAAG